MYGTSLCRHDRFVATATLAAVLAAQGRKRTWLAERAGVSEALLYKIVQRTKSADRRLGERIADALGVPFAVLFEFREKSEMVAEEDDGAEEDDAP